MAKATQTRLIRSHAQRPNTICAAQLLHAAQLVTIDRNQWSRSPEYAVKKALDQKANFLDAAVGTHDRAYLRRGKHGRPVVTRLRAVVTPETAVDLENQMMAQMPERAVLEAISNTEHWAQWSRHFGLPSRLGPQIKDPSHRYVLTTFAYGCGLGPTEAARHLGGTVSADQLAFVDRRHVDIADLRAASADVINLYAKFELPQQWCHFAA